MNFKMNIIAILKIILGLFLVLSILPFSFFLNIHITDLFLITAAVVIGLIFILEGVNYFRYNKFNFRRLKDIDNILKIILGLTILLVPLADLAVPFLFRWIVIIAVQVIGIRLILAGISRLKKS